MNIEANHKFDAETAMYHVTFFPSALRAGSYRVGRKTKADLLLYIRNKAKLFGDVKVWFVSDYMWVVYGGSQTGVYVLCEDGE